MAIALRGTPQVGTVKDGGDVTLTFDVALQQGDLVIVYGGGVRTVTGQPQLAPSTSGYTQIFYNSLYQYISFGVWYKVMGASPDATVVGTGSTGTTSPTLYGCYALSGVHTDIFDQTSVQKGPITNGVPDCDSITTQTANAWVMAIAGQGVVFTGDSTPGTVSGYSNQYNAYEIDIYTMTIAAATLLKASPGVEDPGAWSSWSTATGCRYYAYTLAIKAAASGGAKQVKVNGAWKNISASMVKVNGVWRSISSQMVKPPAGWKQV